MDLDRFSVFVFVIMICQIGATSDGSCPCSEIPELTLTEPPEKSCFQIGERYRYKCISGYVRKVGTSNLIKCNNKGQWETGSLQCIPDPNNPPPTSSGSCPCSEIPKLNLTEPPEKNCSQTATSYHYKCISGYVRKVGTSNRIKCNNKGQWETGLSLQCIPDPNNPPPTSSAETKIPLPQTTTKSHSVIPHDSIITSTVKTSTSLSSEKISTSPAGGTNNMTAVSQGTEKPPTEQDYAVQNVTRSPRTQNETISNPEAYKETVAKTVGIGSFVLILICAMFAISFLIYRRRKKIPPRTNEEMEQMKHLSAVPTVP